MDWGSKFAAAVSLFRRFHEREPRRGEIVQIRSDDPALEIGQVEVIRYRLDDGELYEHNFGRSGRPLLFVSSDGKRAYIVKGRWRFTDRGFVNR